jgi:aldose 1-epimerase
LTNDDEFTVRITNYGGTIVSVIAPDRRGRLGDMVLGFDTLQQYVETSPYVGCIVGRFANPIAGGRFVLNGVTHNLAQNDGPNALHGGRNMKISTFSNYCHTGPVCLKTLWRS